MELSEALNKYTNAYQGVTEVELQFEQYYNGTPALLAELVWEDGNADVSKFSVNLGNYGLVPPPYHVYIPDHTEYRGLVDALEAADMGSRVEMVEYGPFDAQGWLFKINLDKVGGEAIMNQSELDLAHDLSVVLESYGIDAGYVDGVLDSLDSVGLLDHLKENDHDQN